jgi:hypothetical protein
MSKRSSCTNFSLVKILKLNSFNFNSQTDNNYTDLSKAFDRVNLEILFYKLQYFGFSDPLHSWFHSFLTNRFQIVKYQYFCSPKFSVPSGVPQGNHFSTLLFNFFINNLSDIIKKSEIVLFSDDNKLLKIIKDTQDATDL